MRKIEGLCLSSIEDELSFQKWCQINGVNLFLLDGDDTVWSIREIFMDHMSQCCGYLASTCQSLSELDWLKEMRRINDGCFEKIGVALTRWNMVVAQLARERELSQTVADHALDILMHIYETPPKFKDGAEDGLSFLIKSGVEVGIVTHADSPWTWRKYQWLGLDRYLDWEDIYCVDPNGHKTVESWKKAIAYFGRSPRQCAVVGDSPRTDINASRKAGVLHRFCVNLPNRWSLHEQELGSDVWTINGINDLRRLGHSLVIPGH